MGPSVARTIRRAVIAGWPKERNGEPKQGWRAAYRRAKRAMVRLPARERGRALRKMASA